MEDFKMRFSYPAYLTAILLLLLSCGGKTLTPGGSGLIEATEVIVSAETGGQLKALYFDEGDPIKQGDTIAVIDTITVLLHLRDAEALKQAAETGVHSATLGIEQAEFNYDLAKKEYERVGALIKSGSANQQQYDQVETAFQQAGLARKQASAAHAAAQADLARTLAAIDLLRKQWNDCFPLAPRSGTIVDKYIESGELVTPGKQLVKISQLDTVWVKLYLPPEDLTKVKLGGSATIDPEDGQNRTLEGRITWISDAAEFTPKNVQTKEARADLVYAVKITIPNPNGTLKIGMPVAVEIK
jgi:membrane fusion protein YbhG